LRWDAGAPRKLCFERIQVGADATLLISVAYPSSVTATAFTVYANGPHWCNTAWGDSCYASFAQVGSIAEVRASAGDTWHFDPTTGLLSLRIVQPPSDHTGSPRRCCSPQPQP
jgi:hypothetical protein